MSNLNVLREVVDYVKTGPADYDANYAGPDSESYCIMMHVFKRLFPTRRDIDLDAIAEALGITSSEAHHIWSTSDNDEAIERAEAVLAKYEDANPFKAGDRVKSRISCGEYTVISAVGSQIQIDLNGRCVLRPAYNFALIPPPPVTESNDNGNYIVRAAYMADYEFDSLEKARGAVEILKFLGNHGTPKILRVVEEEVK